MRDLYSRRRAITVDLTKWLSFKIAARQRLILIPVLFGNVITPVSRSMRRRMVPDEIILPLFIVVFAQRVGLWLSSCEKLLYPRWPVYHQAALPLQENRSLARRFAVPTAPNRSRCFSLNDIGTPDLAAIPHSRAPMLRR